MTAKLNITNTDLQKNWNEFWAPLVTDEKTGEVNLEQIKKELYDYCTMMNAYAKVLMHVTGGRISKQNTLPGIVISVADEVVNQAIADCAKWDIDEIKAALPANVPAMSAGEGDRYEEGFQAAIAGAVEILSHRLL